MISREKARFVFKSQRANGRKVRKREGTWERSEGEKKSRSGAGGVGCGSCTRMSVFFRQLTFLSNLISSRVPLPYHSHILSISFFFFGFLTINLFLLHISTNTNTCLYLQHFFFTSPSYKESSNSELWV